MAQLNADLRAVRRLRGELGEDHELPTADGKQLFAAGDRLQFTGTDKKRGIYNGAAGTVTGIDGTRLTVQLDGRRGESRSFDAAGFQSFRHGYAGTIYKGQGRTLDQTYLYHSEHWRSAASYVALTRHRDKAELFVASNTARDVTQLARQMARVDDRRAASQFHPQRGPAAADAGPAAAQTAGGTDPVAASEPRDQATAAGGETGDTARGAYVVLREALREAREIAEAARQHEQDDRDRDQAPDRDREPPER